MRARPGKPGNGGRAVGWGGLWVGWGGLGRGIGGERRRAAADWHAAQRLLPVRRRPLGRLTGLAGESGRGFGAGGTREAGWIRDNRARPRHPLVLSAAFRGRGGRLHRGIPGPQPPANPAGVGGLFAAGQICAAQMNAAPSYPGPSQASRRPAGPESPPAFPTLPRNRAQRTVVDWQKALSRMPVCRRPHSHSPQPSARR
jgi:hypothetical protein